MYKTKYKTFEYGTENVAFLDKQFCFDTSILTYSSSFQQMISKLCKLEQV